MKLIEQSKKANVKNNISKQHIDFSNKNGYIVLKNAISIKSLEKFISSVLKMFISQGKKCGYNGVEKIKESGKGIT